MVTHILTSGATIDPTAHKQSVEVVPIDKARQKLVDLNRNSNLFNVKDLKVTTNQEGAIFLTADRQYPLSHRTVYGELKEHLGVNAHSLAEYKDDPELVSKMVEYSLKKRGDKKVMIVSDGVELIDLVSETYPWASPVEAFDKTIEVFGDDCIGLESVRPTGRAVTLRYLSKVAAEPVSRVGDISHAGVWVKSNGVLETAPYIHRLVCTNGALRDWVSNSATTRINLMERFDHSIRTAIKQSIEMLEEFVQLAQHPAENPATFVDQLVRERKYGSKVLKQVVGQLSTLPEHPTQYDVMNLITAQAHATKSEKYEWLGGYASDKFKKQECNHCHRLV